MLLLSTDQPGTFVNGSGERIGYDDSDILLLRTDATASPTGYAYALLFDGSDVGLTADEEDVDALAVLDDGRIILSTTGRASVPGVTAEDEDLLLFTPSPGGLGTDTAGTWSLYFDGGDVGLGSTGEDVDAVSVLPDGRLLISTTGPVTAGGVAGGGEDLLAFRPAPDGLGPKTDGTWTLFFDGSRSGLAGTPENIDAADLRDTSRLHLSTSGTFKAGAAAGRDEDVFTYDLAGRAFAPVLRLDGSAAGLATSQDVDAIQVAPAAAYPAPSAIDVDRVLAVAATKLAAHDAANADKTKYPHDGVPGTGKWATIAPSYWVSGFYPGALWHLYERTNDPAWRSRAEAWTRGLESQKNNRSTHDVGFMMFSSFGHGQRLTGEAGYRDVLRTAARSLSSRYNPAVGALRSRDRDDHEVIIDNLMNLELLFWAAKNGGTTSGGGPATALFDMAVSHAARTLADHVRPDGSTYHVVDYDERTGRVLRKYTLQGKGDETTWSRGQAWAVHGFTTVYRESGDARFLAAARRVADYFLARLPADHVPAADFDSTYTDLAHKDSSAAAIAASGLIELSRLETDPARREKYFAAAARILTSLTSSTYLSTSPRDAGMLLHGSRAYPGNDRSYIYGDYYLIQALTRYAEQT